MHMNDRLAKIIQQPSLTALIATVEQFYNNPSLTNPQAASAALAKNTRIEKLKDDQLITFVQALDHSLQSLPHSPRILICGSRQQIRELRPGDTVITPDSVWQIHADFTEHRVLNTQEMSTLPRDFLPKPDSALTIIPSNDEPIINADAPTATPISPTGIVTTADHKLLTSMLNQALRQKTNSLYVGATNSAVLRRTQAVLQLLKKQYVEPEIAARKWSQLLYPPLNVKTDIQLTQSAEQIYVKGEKIYTKKRVKYLAADEYKIYLIGTLLKTISLKHWSKTQLNILSYISQNYEIQHSHRIVLAGSIQTIDDSGQLEMGDTCIVPEGVFQIGYDRKSYRILDTTQMQKALPTTLQPSAASPITILKPRTHPIPPNHPSVELTRAINQALTHVPQALSLQRSFAANKSSHLIRSGSLETAKSDINYTPNATIMVPDGLYQIDAQSEPQLILSQQDMQQYIPASFLPKAGDPVLEYPIYDETALSIWNQEAHLTSTLMKAFRNNPNAMCLGESHGIQVMQVSDVVSSVGYIADMEKNRRHLYKNNVILRALQFSSDAEFMEFYVTHLQPTQPVSDKQLQRHIRETLEQNQTIDFSHFTDQELREICQQCEVWSPQVSPRILCCQVRPEDYRIGDTLMLPDGVYQLSIDTESGQVQEIKVIDKAKMEALEIHDYIPELATDIRILENYQNDEAAQSLLNELNPILLQHPKGIYLHEQPNRDSGSYGAVNQAVKQMAEQVLQTRLLQRFQAEGKKYGFHLPQFLLFNFRKKSQASSSNPSHTSPHTHTSNPGTKQLRTHARQLKTLQKELRNPDALANRIAPSVAALLAESIADSGPSRSLAHLEASITSVKDELDLNLGGPFSTKTNPDMQEVILLKDKTILMEASIHTVAMHKPLLTEANLKNETKAALFLTALGIPPTEGKHKIKLQGGNHDLRQAVRKLFQQYKEQEFFNSHPDHETLEDHPPHPVSSKSSK